MSQRQNVEQGKLASRLREWLQAYRLTVEDGALKEYMRTLAGLTEEELEISLGKANKENKTNFAPSPGVIYDIAMEMRGGGWAEIDNSPCEYDKTWLENPEWKALKATVAKQAQEKHRPMLPEGTKDLAERREEFFRSPAQMAKWAAQREYLMAHYLSQDLNDGGIRSQAEIAAIKASRPKSKRKAVR